MSIRTNELIPLIIMLIPFLSLIGVILYFVKCGGARGKKLIIMLLTIPLGFLAGIFLWLDALGIITL